MGLHALGDTAWLFYAGGSSSEKKLELVLHLRQLLERHMIREIIDIVSSFDTIAVYFDPADGQKVLDHLTSLHIENFVDKRPLPKRTIMIPVLYGGADLEALAKAKKLSVAEIIKLHGKAEFTVATIGFSPGFPYLQGLPEQLYQPRHSSPKQVAAGSVAIAGNQAGIYPFASQGGWHVIGRSDTKLFNPDREHPALLQPGDKVRFVETESIGRSEHETRMPETLTDDILVIEPGALSSIQDHGRWGRQHLGISPGGAADLVLASIANRLVGNLDKAAVIECTMAGAVLQFNVDARVCWVGWADASSGKPYEIKAGERIDLRKRMCHLRGYIAVAGGVDVPQVLGSRATDLRAILGGHQGRTLQAGDVLPIGNEKTAPVSKKWHVTWPHPEGCMIELRYLRGMQADWFSQKSLRLFTENFYTVSASCDRTGTPLKGAKLELKEPREMISQPVVFGSVQVPPDGQPIVLMSERQTIGGYPQIGHVISADIPKLARAWPGTKVHFREVDLNEARDAWNELQCDLGILKAGLMMKLT